MDQTFLMAINLITSGAFAPSRSPAAKSLLHAAQEAEFDQSIFRRYSMSYTDMDIEMKALSMLGSNVPDEDAVMLRTVCAAAAAAGALFPGSPAQSLREGSGAALQAMI